MINNRFFRHHQHDENCGCGEHHHEHELEDSFDDESLIQIEDEETGEVFDFYMADEFEHKDDLYYVLVPVSEEDEDMVYVIARVVEEDGESYIETLSDEENEELYDVYDQILDEAFMEDSDDEDDEFEADHDFLDD